jgi:hypothetical protein
MTSPILSMPSIFLNMFFAYYIDKESIIGLASRALFSRPSSASIMPKSNFLAYRKSVLNNI